MVSHRDFDMRPRDLFGVGIRLIGLYFLSQAFYWGFWLIAKTQTHGALGNPKISAGEDAAYALLYLVLGLLLMVLADHIVLICYGPQRVASDSNATDPENGT